MAQDRSGHFANWFQSSDRSTDSNLASTLREEVDQGDNATISTTSTHTINTPTQSLIGDIGSFGVPTVPSPGTTFVLRSVSCARVLTLLGGQVVLANPNTRGSILWECIETKGWLGFRNVVSGKMLGHNEQGRLRCSVDKHLNWENFCLRPQPGGGYVLLMQQKEKLWRVDNHGADGLSKVEKNTGGVVWEFIEVDSSTTNHSETSL